MADAKVNHAADDFLIVWLDSTIETSKYNQDTKALIRRIVKGRLRTFTDPDQCIGRTMVELENKRVFFIVSNTFGKDVVPVIHNLPQIQTIYVYCGNRQLAEGWAKSHSKVTGIFTSQGALLKKICDDVLGCDENAKLPTSVFHLEERQNSLQNLTKESTTFMWYYSILTVLRSMAKYYNSKNEMIAECRLSYADDEAENKKINDFEKNYEPTKAFWWYTYDSFVYRLLNQALRTQNMEIIFKFRFFIHDLHTQIERLYHQYLSTQSLFSRKRLTVYRGQRLSNDELDSLKRNVNELVSMNSFLSATKLREIAEIFAGAGDQCNESSSVQSVLFIIEICDMSKETTPFAFIESYSSCQDEEEVLFTIGAIFKIQSVEKHQNMWHVNLQLSKQQNELCKDLSSHMIKQMGPEPGPLSFGWFLYRTSEFKQAERYIQILLKEFPRYDKEAGHAYNLLGLIYKDTKHLTQSIQCYEKALDIYSRSSLYNSPSVIVVHCNLGLAALALGDNRRADEQQKQAEQKLLSSSSKKDPILMTTIISLKANVQIANGDYTSALENLEEVLRIKKKKLPATHPSIASTLNQIGVVEEKMGHYDEALKYYKKAFEIHQKTLPPGHLDLAEYHKNIGRIYEIRDQPGLASNAHQLALQIEMTHIRRDSE